MKMLLVVLALIASSARAAVTAEVTFDVRGNRLWAEVRMHGIAEGESFPYSFRWTASDVAYQKKDGTKIRLFADGTFEPTSPAGASTPGGCYCKDTKEKGCWRTRAWRNIETILGNGDKVRGTGKWTVRIVRNDTGAVIGSGDYTVE